MKDFKIILTFSFVLFAAHIFAGGWIQRSNFGSVGRHRLTGFSIGTKGYAGLGHYNGTGQNIIYKDWWEYDPATNSWTQKADYIGNNGNGNYGVLAFGLNGFGYIGGGQNNTSSEFFKFDPIANTWTPAAPSPTSVANTFGFTIGDFGYYITGSTMYKYDPTIDQWTTIGTNPFYVSSWYSAFEVNGYGYVKDNLDLWQYDPVNDLWEQKASSPGTAISASVSFTHRGKGYIVAGFTGAWSNVVSEVVEYDPVTDSWAIWEEFPGTSRRFATGFTIGDRSYFGLGTNGTNFNDFWEFTGTIGVDELQESDDFNVFPNPATDFVSFQHQEGNPFSVTVTDPMGRIVFEEKSISGKVTLHRNDLPAGNYHSTITTQNGNHFTKSFIFI